MKRHAVELPSGGWKSMKNYFLLIVVSAFLVYSNSISNGYSLDDAYVTVIKPGEGNDLVAKGIKGIPGIFTTHYIHAKEVNFEYRPVPLVLFAIEYQLFGANPHVSHLINVLLFVSTCLLLFVVLLRLFKNYTIVLPVLTTLLFVVHPIHTEVVNNIKCRDELMAFFFGLCALYFFLRSRESGQVKFYVLSVLCLLTGLLCKKTAVIFIPVIPLAGYFFGDLKLKGAVFQLILFGMIMLVYKLIQKILLPGSSEIRTVAFYENPLFYEKGFLIRLFAVFSTLAYYLKLFVFPFKLSCYYGYNVVPVGDGLSLFILFSTLIYMCAAGYAIYKFSEKSALSFGILVYLAGIFPFANIMEPVVGIIGERFVYTSSLGFCIIASYLLILLSKAPIKNKQPGLRAINPAYKSIFLAVLLIYSFSSVARNAMWKNEIKLLRNDVSNFPNSCNLHALLADKLYKEIHKTSGGAEQNLLITEATLHFRKQLDLMQEGVKKYPGDNLTLNNIGIIYDNILNDPAIAQLYYKKVIDNGAANAIVRYNFASCYEKRNLTDSATAAFEALVSADSKELPVRKRLHDLYLKKGNYRKAVANDLLALQQDRENPFLYLNVASAYSLSRDTSNAFRYYELAARKDSLNANLLLQVAAAFHNYGNENKAREYTEKAQLLMHSGQ